MKWPSVLCVIGFLLLQACQQSSIDQNEANVKKKHRKDAAGYNVQLGLGYLKQGNIPLFRKRLNEVADQCVAWRAADLELAIDSEIPLAEVDPKFLQDLERLAPFGPGNRKPFFISKNVRLKGSVKKRGKDTLQCWISDAEGKTTCEMVGFRKFDRWAQSANTGPLDIVHQPSLRDFNGILSIQLELEDWRQG